MFTYLTLYKNSDILIIQMRIANFFVHTKKDKEKAKNDSAWFIISIIRQSQ